MGDSWTGDMELFPAFTLELFTSSPMGVTNTVLSETIH